MCRMLPMVPLIIETSMVAACSAASRLGFSTVESAGS